MVLESTGQLPVMRITGSIVDCNLMTSKVVPNRVESKITNIDKYVVRLQVEPDKYSTIVENANHLVDYWLQKNEELFTILNTSLTTRKREDCDKMTVDILFYRLLNPNEVIFSKNVASPIAPPKSGPISLLFPTTAEQTMIIKPDYFSWNPRSLYLTLK